MKEVTMWQAFDGKTFDDIDECQNYENGIMNKKYNHFLDKVFMWDINYRELIPKDFQAFVNLFDEAYYVVFSEEAMPLMNYLSEEIDDDAPRTGGMWQWNDRRGCWDKLPDDEYQLAQNRANFLKKMLDKNALL